MKEELTYLCSHIQESFANIIFVCTVKWVTVTRARMIETLRNSPIIQPFISSISDCAFTILPPIIATLSTWGWVELSCKENGKAKRYLGAVLLFHMHQVFVGPA
jgi:hypothetical protein